MDYSLISQQHCCKLRISSSMTNTRWCFATYCGAYGKHAMKNCLMGRRARTPGGIIAQSRMLQMQEPVPVSTIPTQQPQPIWIPATTKMVLIDESWDTSKAAGIVVVYNEQGMLAQTQCRQTTAIHPFPCRGFSVTGCNLVHTNLGTIRGRLHNFLGRQGFGECGD